MSRTKPVWQTSREGFLVGVTEADESPLEPGVWLIPLGAVEVAPPKNLPDGHIWRWNGRNWITFRLRRPLRERIKRCVGRALRRLVIMFDPA